MNIYAPAMYPSHWYNGDKGNNEMYISDMSSVLIGMPRIRQLRIERSKRGVKYYIFVFHYLFVISRGTSCSFPFLCVFGFFNFDEKVFLRNRLFT